MAEFQEVAKQAKRLCRAYANSCTGCPLADQDDRCLFEVGNADCIPEEWKSDQLAEAESIVMSWAAEHPEPMYPSWNDAWKQLFPEHSTIPCVKMFMGKKESGCTEQAHCRACLNRPIPADVAEKLGIKPVEG